MSDLYRFEEFVLDPKKRTLSWEGSPVHLTPKAFDILLFLVRNPNRVVSKQELMKAVWPDTFVEESNLTFNVSQLRKSLAERPPDDRLIVTLARQGYQFTGDVTVADGVESLAPASSTGLEPRVATATPLPAQGVGPPGPPTGPAPGALALAHATRWRSWAIAGGLSVIVLVASYLGWRRSRPPALPAQPATRLAVLPCLNLTGDPKQEYLADGITEELISRLAQLDPQELSVIARTSVMAYKQPAPRLEQIAHDLDVQRVLESSVRGNAGRLRITVQLIDVANQSHLWSSDYDYQSGEILRLEEDVAAAVARHIQLQLTPRLVADQRPTHAVVQGAFDAYLQGHYLFERFSKDDLEQAVGYYKEAIRLDSSYALAWVGLSRARRRQAESGWIEHEQGYREARETADRALALEPDLGVAYSNLAWIQINHDWDWEGANASVQQALRLDPGNADIVEQASDLAASLGHLDEALATAKRSVQLDPANPGTYGSLGQVLYYMNRPEEAAANMRRAMAEGSADPDLGHLALSRVYLAQGHAQEALVEAGKAHDPEFRLFGEALAHFRLGHRAESDSALTELMAKPPSLGAYLIGTTYAYRGQKDEAFRWLERAYDQRDGNLEVLKIDPLLNDLRSDPRYTALVAKMHLPQ
jgi:TolB-like protein/DNA-binding winged helix-turn-helix (wHTH) protein/Flp pilus assembly protein TadD